MGISFVEYQEIKNRMCKINKNGSCMSNCFKCGLSSHLNSKGIVCRGLESLYPQEAEEIVQKWADDNSPKTYKDVLLEKFPNAKMNGEIPAVCVANMFGESHSVCPDILCSKCWSRPYEEKPSE